MLICMKTTHCDIKFPPKFLGQEISSCDKKFLPVTIQFVARNFFMWQEISFCGKKFFLWQDISSLEKYLIVTLILHENHVTLPKRKFFLWHKNMSSYYRKALVRQVLCIIWQEIPSCQVCDKTRKFLPTFRVSLKIPWEPGSLAPGEYPTLPKRANGVREGF